MGMTYGKAAQHNVKFGENPLFKDPMRQNGEEKNFKWVQDPSGMIGYVAYKNHEKFLVHYPLQVLKVNYRLTIKSWPNEAIQQFREVK